MKLLALVSILAIVAIAGCVGQSAAPPAPAAVPTAPAPLPAPPAPAPPSAAGATVRITESGFSPSTVTIKLGETVTWVNDDTGIHWPASAAHPTHTVYPEGGGCIGSAFDACTGLRQGESWSFTFNQAGSWDYHDHLKPGFFGKVIVE